MISQHFATLLAIALLSPLPRAAAADSRFWLRLSNKLCNFPTGTIGFNCTNPNGGCGYSPPENHLSFCEFGEVINACFFIPFSASRALKCVAVADEAHYRIFVGDHTTFLNAIPQTQARESAQIAPVRTFAVVRFSLKNFH